MITLTQDTVLIDDAGEPGEMLEFLQELRDLFGLRDNYRYQFQSLRVTKTLAGWALTITIVDPQSERPPVEHVVRLSGNSMWSCHINSSNPPQEKS